jgi:ABC-type sugar transport system, ATPase component
MALLALNNVSKHFGAIHALNEVSLSLEPGQVVGLMGDNGAGKSTLVKIIAGNFRPTHGTMQMEGQDCPCTGRSKPDRHGIEIVHQDLALCDNLSAAANVFSAVKCAKASARSKSSTMLRCTAGPDRSSPNCDPRPGRAIWSGRCPAASGRRWPLARTRIADAKIVLMDEPTAAISVRQVAEVLNLMRRLRDRGIAIVFISHRMPDVFSIADRVVVLRRGRKVADKDVAASSPEEVTGLITGAIEHA